MNTPMNRRQALGAIGTISLGGLLAACDGDGDEGGGGTRGGGGAQTGTRYLRGAHATDADGIAEFVTIYPGWYPGRTVHVHAKVHLDAKTVLTTQLYFDDDVSDEVFGAKAYAGRGDRTERNASDGIFDQALVMTARKDDGGYVAAMNIDVRRA